MIRRDVIKLIVQDYLSTPDICKIEQITDIVARQLEIAAFELIRKLCEEYRRKRVS